MGVLLGHSLHMQSARAYLYPLQRTTERGRGRTGESEREGRREGGRKGEGERGKEERGTERGRVWKGESEVLKKLIMNSLH